MFKSTAALCFVLASASILAAASTPLSYEGTLDLSTNTLGSHSPYNGKVTLDLEARGTETLRLVKSSVRKVETTDPDFPEHPTFACVTDLEFTPIELTLAVRVATTGAGLSTTTMSALPVSHIDAPFTGADCVKTIPSRAEVVLTGTYYNTIRTDLSVLASKSTLELHIVGLYGHAELDGNGEVRAVEFEKRALGAVQWFAYKTGDMRTPDLVAGEVTLDRR